MYNDAEFTEKDWEGIRSAGFSEKKENVDKVGRFGMGFSSVYHLTGPSHIHIFIFCFTFILSLDSPWILSGTKLLMMDPTLQHLHRHTRMWDFSKDEHKKNWAEWKDMTAPWAQMLDILGLPDVFNGERLVGTLFRLPLRNQTSKSPLAADKSYSCR